MSGSRDAPDAPNGAERLRNEVRQLRARLREAEQRVRHLESQLGSSSLLIRQSGPTQRELKLLAEQIERQTMLLERDEHVARELQRSLTPVLEERPEGVEFAIETKPGVRVGGDFYDIISIADQFVAMLIADVSGYGLPAAVIMATGRLAFRTYAANELNPRTIMTNVNRALLRTTLAGHYMTAFLGVLDTELLTLQYVNASHCSPLVVRDGEVIALDTEGLFVGMFEDPQYEQKGMQLEKDDRLLFYTDGLLKAFEAKDRHGSQAQLADYVKRHADLSIQELVSRLANLSDRPDDDVAVMGVELRQEKARTKTLTIPSIPGQLGYVENAILPVLTNKGYGERALFAVKLALEEATINAIKHGNQLDDTKKVSIRFTVADDRVIISVADEGEGFDPAAVPDPTRPENLTIATGRGLALIRAYMDEVSFNEKGNEITMVKLAPWSKAGAS